MTAMTTGWNPSPCGFPVGGLAVPYALLMKRGGQKVGSIDDPIWREPAPAMRRRQRFFRRRRVSALALLAGLVALLVIGGILWLRLSRPGGDPGNAVYYRLHHNVIGAIPVSATEVLRGASTVVQWDSGCSENPRCSVRLVQGVRHHPVRRYRRVSCCCPRTDRRRARTSGLDPSRHLSGSKAGQGPPLVPRRPPRCPGQCLRLRASHRPMVHLGELATPGSGRPAVPLIRGS